MWQRISKKEIKQVQIGHKIRVNSTEAILLDQYPGQDTGFKYAPKDSSWKSCLIFSSSEWECSEWEDPNVVEVWVDDEFHAFDTAMKEFEEKWGVKIGSYKQVKKLPEFINVGQILNVRADGSIEIMQLVQYAPKQLQLICVITGNRYDDELKIPAIRTPRGPWSARSKDIASVGIEILDILENPFKGML